MWMQQTTLVFRHRPHHAAWLFVVLFTVAYLTPTGNFAVVRTFTMRLCDAGPILELKEDGDHFRLEIIEDDAVVQLPLPREVANEVLNGGRAQTSHRHGYCRLDGEADGHVRLTYCNGQNPVTCRVSK